MEWAPDVGSVLEPGDILLVLGVEGSISRLEKMA